MENSNKPEGSPREQFTPSPAPRGSRAPLIITATLVIIAVLAGFYLYGLSLALEDEAQRAAAEQAKRSSDVNVSGDAEIDAIERDLNAVDIGNSDQEMDDIDKEF